MNYFLYILLFKCFALKEYNKMIIDIISYVHDVFECHTAMTNKAFLFSHTFLFLWFVNT